MENPTFLSDVWTNTTTCSSTDDDLTQYVAHISNRAVKIIYIIIGTIGIIDNLFVIVIFALFIKITDKVFAIYASSANNTRQRLLLACLLDWLME